MSDITYERLKLNIAEEEVNGAQVTVTFKCPVTEKMYHAVTTMRPATGVGAKVQKQAKNELLSAARRGFRGLLRSVLGGGSVGRVAGNVASSSVPSSSGVVYDKSSRETAVVDAFRPLAVNFVWDDARKAYIDATEAADTMSAFDKQLKDHPIDGKWERGVAARMLAEIVAADGKVEDEEREFFEAFLTDDTGSLDELIKGGPLSELELSETKPNGRATMLMLAYSIAMTDEKLDAAEQAALARFAKGLGVSQSREESLRQWASEKVIENMLVGCYADGQLDDAERARISSLAQNIGINEALVAKIDVRVRKRLGA